MKWLTRLARSYNENIAEPNRRDMERRKATWAERDAERKAAQQPHVELQQWIKDHKHERVAKIGSLHVFPDRVIRVIVSSITGKYSEEPQVKPLDGVTFTLENTGGVAYRGTLTRSAIAGGWQRKEDTREQHITVDGPDFQWSMTLGPNSITWTTPREFVTAANTAARRYAASRG